MSVYRDKQTWRYRKWVRRQDRTRVRITGTPSINTRVAAESAERAHVDWILNPSTVSMPRHLSKKAAPEEKGVPTIAEFAPDFEAEYLPRSKPTERRSKKSIINGAGGIVEFFGHLRLDEINQGHVNKYVAALGKLSTKTINNKLTVLSTMLRYAHALNLIPAPKVKCHIKSMSPDIVAVPAQDVARLVAAAGGHPLWPVPPWFRITILLATEAGLRIGEIRGLQWTDIKSGQLTVRRAIDQSENVTTPKHDKRRSVPLSPALESALAALPRQGLWVCSDKDGRAWTYDAALAAINALYTVASVAVPVSETGVTMPWHSLRHTFGTELAARGVPIPVIKELMGHASIATTMRYVTVTGAQLDAAIEHAFGSNLAKSSAREERNTDNKKAKTPGVTGGSD